MKTLSVEVEWWFRLVEETDCGLCSTLHVRMSCAHMHVRMYACTYVLNAALQVGRRLVMLDSGCVLKVGHQVSRLIHIHAYIGIR